MRSKSASYLFAFAASGHHGPSVRLASVSGVNAPLPSPMACRRVAYAVALATLRIAQTQFSPTGQEPIGNAASSPGGAGPYVVERLALLGATNAGDAGSP